MKRPKPLTMWQPKPTQCTWNATPDNVHVVFLLVLFSLASSSSLIAHDIAWLKWSACLHSSHPCMKWASLFDFELFIPSNFFLLSFNIPQSLLPFYFHDNTRRWGLRTNPAPTQSVFSSVSLSLSLSFCLSLCPSLSLSLSVSVSVSLSVCLSLSLSLCLSLSPPQSSSGFVSSPLFHAVAISSQVPVCPTRNVTNDVMPLAGAITQLSFVEFLQRCGIPIALLQPSQLPVSMSLQDAALRRFSGCVHVNVWSSGLLVIFWCGSANVSPRYPHLISGCCRTDDPTKYAVSARVYTNGFSLSFLFLLIFFRLPYAVWCYTMLLYNYRSRSSLLAASSRTILWTAKTLFVSPRHQYRVQVPCCSHRQDSSSSPRFLVPPLALICTLHMAHYHSCTSTSLATFSCFSYAQSYLLLPPMWDHIIYVLPPQAKEMPVLPWWERKILLIRMHVQGLFFLNRVPSFFLWSTLVHPNLMGKMVLILLTAISCIINSAFPFYMEPRPGA